MKQENLLKKYEITKEQYDKGVDAITESLGKIVGVKVVFAIADLLVNGDIKAEE